MGNANQEEQTQITRFAFKIQDLFLMLVDKV